MLYWAATKQRVRKVQAGMIIKKSQAEIEAMKEAGRI